MRAEISSENYPVQKKASDNEVRACEVHFLKETARFMISLMVYIFAAYLLSNVNSSMYRILTKNDHILQCHHQRPSMALTLAVEFRALLAQLTAEETSTFIDDLVVSNPQLVIQLLSERFINQSNTGTKDPLDIHCIASISTIIQSREENSSVTNKAAFDLLPLRIIGLCSSFLDQTSYKELSVCNRSTYLGCNTPIMLREIKIEYSYDSNQFPVDLSSFPMTTKLTPRVRMIPGIPRRQHSDSVEIILSQIARMPRLRSLDLHLMDYQAVKMIANHETINRMVECVTLQYHCISSLSSFKHLHFLHLNIDDEDAVATQFEMRAMSQTLRNLRGLTLIDNPSEFGGQLLAAIGHQLEYLELNYIQETELEQTDFRNLKQFRMHDHCSFNTRSQILKTATNLEKVEVSFCDEDDSWGCWNDGIWHIHKMLKNCENLEYLEIYSSTHETDFFHSILDPLHGGVFGSREYEKRMLEIKFTKSRHAIEFDLDDECVIHNIGLIINNLLLCKADHWMMLWPETGKKVENFIKKLRDSMSTNIWVSDDKESNLTVITNRDCTINGYTATWLMP